MNTSSRPSSLSGSKGLIIAAAVAGVIAVVGIGLWVNQTIEGLHVTAMRNTSSWGLYIAMFMLFVGLSAGGLIISSAPKALSLKGFDGISKVSVVISIVCTVLAIAYVIVDLGHPERVWHLFVYGQMNSPLMWDMLILSAYLILSIVYLWMLMRADEGKVSGKALKAMSIIALIIAVLVHSITAWIFSLNISRPFWNTALMAPWFVTSALVSGLGLVLLVAAVLNRGGSIKLDREDFFKLGRMLGVFVAIDLFLFFCDILTGVFPGAGLEHDLMGQLLSGALAPIFWVELVTGAIVLLLMFAPALRMQKTALVVASVLAVVCVFCKRFLLIEGGFQIPNIDFPGGAAGLEVPGAGAWWQQLGASLAYWPSGYELLVTVGVLALGVCLFLLALKFLPLFDRRGVQETKVDR
jgi:molybdopterin-containing oxidoreductase family membrane subunit